MEFKVGDRVLFVGKYPGTIDALDRDLAHVVFDADAFPDGLGQQTAWVVQHSLALQP